MKKIIAMLALACLSLVAGAQSKFDTGTHAKTALGQAEEMSGMKVTTSKPKGNYTIITPAARAVSAASPISSSGNSTLSLATGIITSFLFSALDALEDSRSSAHSTVGTYSQSYSQPVNPVAPDIIDECDADIVNKFPQGCKFERHYPVPGDKDWYLEMDMTNESSVDHDFTVIYWEKEGRDGTPRLKVLRSGLPQNRIKSYITTKRLGRLLARGSNLAGGGVLTFGKVGHQGLLVVLKGGGAFGRDATDGVGAAAGAACGHLDIAGVL